MRKKSGKAHHSFYPGIYPGNPNTSFSTLLDVIDPERKAQRRADLKAYMKQKKEGPLKSRPAKPEKSCKPSHKPEEISFSEKLKRTQKWLQETFPALFDPSQPCKALDVHIVRDIKIHYYKDQYKNPDVEREYPSDLVIKAALYRYMKSPEYLACLVEGAPRYNIKSEIASFVQISP